jgi:hypothetical protein
MSEIFRICTLVTRPEQYAAMKASFLAAGFDESRCRYEVFDNSVGNCFEPHALLTRLVRETIEPYVILCHQDVLADRGDGFDKLLAEIDRLNRLDPQWAIAGTAGCSDDFEFASMVHDPNGFPPWSGRLPLPVHSLDENFLLMKSGTGIGCSQELFGFHLYGTDICLNARLAGRTCDVIDFQLSHLSAGRFDETFFTARRAFIEHWNRRFNLVYVIREADIVLSRWKFIHWLGSRGKVRRLLRKFGPLRRWVMRELGDRRQSDGGLSS